MSCGCQNNDLCGRKLKWLNGYTGRLSGRLSATDSVLPVADAGVLAALLSDGFCGLRISDGARVEIVKASSFGGMVQIQRGLAGSVASDFPVGACVRWELIEESFNSAVCAFLVACGLFEVEQHQQTEPMKIQVSPLEVQFKPEPIEIKVKTDDLKVQVSGSVNGVVNASNGNDAGNGQNNSGNVAPPTGGNSSNDVNSEPPKPENPVNPEPPPVDNGGDNSNTNNSGNQSGDSGGLNSNVENGGNSENSSNNQENNANSMPKNNMNPDAGESAGTVSVNSKGCIEQYYEAVVRVEPYPLPEKPANYEQRVSNGDIYNVYSSLRGIIPNEMLPEGVLAHDYFGLNDTPKLFTRQAYYNGRHVYLSITKKPCLTSDKRRGGVCHCSADDTFVYKPYP